MLNNSQFLNEYAPLLASIALYFFVTFVLSVAYRTLLCAAVSFDAKARGVKERTLYTVLTFFFPLIVGIVYLCTRKNCAKIQPKICNQCGMTLDTGSTFCPNCLCTEFTDYRIQHDEEYHKKSKVLLIIAIVIYAVTCTVNVFANIYFDKNAEQFINDAEKFSNGYFDNFNNDSEDFDDYFDNFGFEYDEPQETQPQYGNDFDLD
ncbi:hypothetical protein [uncultured Eubacterium sp.]|uniref:hypothetical protein n=1 Tax=uncultured Eubacterium sp. TaxID=165185 RepID=UPI0015B27877|nr:hypothetical protein [uncultured Eubacterium sp.]